MDVAGPSIGKWTWFTPVMHALDPVRRKGMRKTLAILDQQFPLRPGVKVLDVAAGTGTLLTALVSYGCDVRAIEPTGAMFRHVQKRFPQLSAHQEPAHAMRSIADKSQDLTIVSATLHGFTPSYRREVYRELSRVTRGAVAVIDYHWNLNPFVALIELLEGGDYFHFMRTAEHELREAFGDVVVTRCSDIDSLYLCRVR